MKKLRQSISKRSLSFTSSSSSLKSSSTEQPISPPPEQIKQNYHHVPLGSGGVMNRKDRFGGGQIYVGTTATVNTVGVFFEVTDTLCFLCHINAFVTRLASSEPTQRHYTANFRTAEQIRATVMARLGAELKGTKTQRMKQTLVMTCARLSGQGPTVAEIVAKAIREWLEVDPAGGGGRVASVGTSFTVGWPAGVSLVFQEAPSPENWVPIDCDIGMDAWNLRFEERELEGSDESW